MYTNEFLLKLAHAIDSELVTHKVYIDWCERKIGETEVLPRWIYDLSIEKDSTKASRILIKAAYDNFEESYSLEDYSNFWICCNYIRYKKDELSWPMFLQTSGEYSDAFQSRWACEEYYRLLDELSNSEFNTKVQENIFFKVHSDVIEEVLNFQSQLNNVRNAT